MFNCIPEAEIKIRNKTKSQFHLRSRVKKMSNSDSSTFRMS